MITNQNQNQNRHPNINDVAYAAFLHDIGKFSQRAHGSSRQLPQEVRNLESSILPTAGGGRYSHYHVLWTEAFFYALEQACRKHPVTNPFPGADFATVRQLAINHHKPRTDQPLDHLIVTADHLASSLDRKERDAADEQEQVSLGRFGFIKVPLRNIFDSVDLGIGSPPETYWVPCLLEPGEKLLPTASPDRESFQQAYKKLWDRFFHELKNLVNQSYTPAVFQEALLSLSERFMFAVPSSTKDEPDVSLHDHSRLVAAFATALYRWHEEDGSLDNTNKIKDISIPKFRFLTGDLSGIQKTLFLLASQQVRGASKILRARSFSFALIAEAAALLARQRLGLTPFNVLTTAGGQFLMLVPDLPGIEQTIEKLRRDIDDWLYQRYLGELALNIGLSGPLAGEEFSRNNYAALQQAIRETIAEAKLRPFSTVLPASHTGLFDTLDFSHGPCSACNRRPGTVSIGDGLYRCDVCQEEFRLGGILPKTVAFAWVPKAGQLGQNDVEFFDRLILRPIPVEEPYIAKNALSAYRVYLGKEETTDKPLALRFLANYVPKLTVDDFKKTAYQHLSEESRKEAEPGDIKTFEHIALDGIEARTENDQLILRGEDYLAVLKADVDRLGLIFSLGLKEPSLSRYISLSRMLDFFFTGQLMEILRNKYKSVYTVYAGGDDLLLVGHWRHIMCLASKMQQALHEWTAGNPNITISAGISLLKVHQPVYRAVSEAEENLEYSKGKGLKDQTSGSPSGKATKNAITALPHFALSWENYRGQLEAAAKLYDFLVEGKLTQSFVYRLLTLARQREEAEQGVRRPIGPSSSLNLLAASWRARYAYQIARNIDDNKRLSEDEKTELKEFLNNLLGLDLEFHPRKDQQWQPPYVTLTAALYRYRKFRG